MTTKSQQSRQMNKEKKEKRWTWKHPKDRPKKPQHAYNLFYRDVRQRLLDEMRMGAQKSASDKRNRKNGLGLKNLSNIVSAEWKRIDPSILAYYQRMASIKRENYFKDLDEWKQWKKAQERKNNSQNTIEKGIVEDLNESVTTTKDKIISNKKQHTSSSSSSINVTSRLDNSSVDQKMSSTVGKERTAEVNGMPVPSKVDKTTMNASIKNEIENNQNTIRSLASLNKMANTLSCVHSLPLKMKNSQMTSTQQEHDSFNMVYTTEKQRVWKEKDIGIQGLTCNEVTNPTSVDSYNRTDSLSEFSDVDIMEDDPNHLKDRVFTESASEDSATFNEEQESLDSVITKAIQSLEKEFNIFPTQRESSIDHQLTALDEDHNQYVFNRLSTF